VSEPLRIVHIGAGNFSRANHSPCLQRLSAGPTPRVSMEAICDLDESKAQAFCDDFGYKKAYTDIDEMMGQVEPDVVYVMVHPRLAAGVLERVLRYRLPTFTEKPPGVTVAESIRLAELAQECGNVTYVGFNRRRTPVIEHLKSWAAGNGPVRYVRAEMIRNRRFETGFAIGTAIHPLDCLRYLCGNVVELETICKAYEGTPRDYLVRMRFDTGIMADLAVLVHAGLSRERYMVHVAGGLMEATPGGYCSSDFCDLGQKAYSGNQVVAEGPFEDDLHIGLGFMGEHLAFLEAATSGMRPDCCLQDGQHSVKLGVAVQEGYSGPMASFEPSEPDPYAT